VLTIIFYVYWKKGFLTYLFFHNLTLDFRTSVSFVVNFQVVNKVNLTKYEWLKRVTWVSMKKITNQRVKKCKKEQFLVLYHNLLIQQMKVSIALENEKLKINNNNFNSILWQPMTYSTISWREFPHLKLMKTTPTSSVKEMKTILKEKENLLRRHRKYLDLKTKFLGEYWFVEETKKNYPQGENLSNKPWGKELVKIDNCNYSLREKEIKKNSVHLINPCCR